MTALGPIVDIPDRISAPAKPLSYRVRVSNASGC
jgi:hypothetical protein